jgi:hypothetical protein
LLYQNSNFSSRQLLTKQIELALQVWLTILDFNQKKQMDRTHSVTLLLAAHLAKVPKERVQDSTLKRIEKTRFETIK